MSDIWGLNGSVVIVTGGAGMLGREYVRALASAGAHAVVADIDGAAAEDVASRAKGAIAVRTDVTDPGSVDDLITTTRGAFGRIDGLLNNAALDPKFSGQRTDSGALETLDAADWRRSIDVDLTGMFLCARAAGGVMAEQGRGSIVNVCSVYGVVGPDQRLYRGRGPDGADAFKPASYSVAKGAVPGLTRYLATYWGTRGVRANTLTLGGVDDGHDDAFRDAYAQRTPLGRMAQRQECVGPALFLLSPLSSYMTGANLIVDGGWTAW